MSVKPMWKEKLSVWINTAYGSVVLEHYVIQFGAEEDPPTFRAFGLKDICVTDIKIYTITAKSNCLQRSKSTTI